MWIHGNAVFIPVYQNASQKYGQFRPVESFVMVGSLVKMSATMVGWRGKILKFYWLKCPKTVPKIELRTRKWMIKTLFGVYLLISDFLVESLTHFAIQFHSKSLQLQFHSF